MDPTSLKFFVGKYPFRALQSASGEYSGEIRTCPVRLSFVKFTNLKAGDNGKTAYQATLLVPKGADVSVLRTCTAQFAANKYGPDWQRMAQTGALEIGIKGPQHKATRGKNAGKAMAELYKGFDEIEVFIDVKRSVEADAPKIFDGALNPLPLEKVYSGMWALATIRPYDWSNNGRRGVSFGLQSIQKLADDEEFRGDDGANSYDVIEHPGGVSAPSTPANAGAASAPTGNNFWG